MRGTGGSKPIYLRGLPAQLVREAKALAARRGITLASFVAEAIVQAIQQAGAPAEESTAPLNLQSDELASEMRWFEQNRERLARTLSGEYVAIVQREVIDHDTNFDALARRVFAKVGTRNVFMPLVGPKTAPLRLRSPRLDSSAARSRPSRATRAR
jgi:hypothetical protein